MFQESCIHCSKEWRSYDDHKFCRKGGNKMKSYPNDPPDEWTETSAFSNVSFESTMSK